jgi:hypothetical protein
MGRRVWLLCAALVLALSGCTTGAPSHGITISAGPAGPAPTPTTSACPMGLILTETDTGATPCIAVGGTILVELHVQDGQDWALPQTSVPDVLRPSGTATTSEHVARAVFVAARPGTADITSSRSACPSPAPGSAACHAIAAFRVTVTVR